MGEGKHSCNEAGCGEILYLSKFDNAMTKILSETTYKILLTMEKET